jgi:hypothetical protein
MSENRRSFQSKFLKGLSQDIDNNITPNENYISASNLTLTGDNKFLALENIKGTQELETILSSFSGEVLGVYGNKYAMETLETTNRSIPGLASFTQEGSDWTLGSTPSVSVTGLADSSDHIWIPFNAKAGGSYTLSYNLTKSGSATAGTVAFRLIQDGTSVSSQAVVVTSGGTYSGTVTITGQEASYIGVRVTCLSSGTLSVTLNSLSITSSTEPVYTTDSEFLTIFTAHQNNDLPIEQVKFKIWAYDIDNDVKYELFEEDIVEEDPSRNLSNPDYLTSDRTIDAVVYPENGVDIIYFTDNYNEIRKVRCEIPYNYSANFLSPEQISLNRRGPMVKMSLHSIQTTGGSLLCGSYQFSVRFYNQDRKAYTKWSIPSVPVNITQVNSEIGLGSYNAVSTKYVRIRMEVPDEEYALYTHYQMAVIENTQSENTLNASLLRLEPLSFDSLYNGLTLMTVDYKNNNRVNFVPLSDIVVDLAAIDHVKTLQIKNNKLFAGNVTYKNLEYDRTPTITGGTIQRTVVDNTNDYHTSTRKGLFRDEVYRFYVSYYDDNYNFSRPIRLNMNAVTGNQTTNGDLKTPTKKSSSYTLLDGSSSPTNLILSLTITNHPSWSRGFVILRAKRKARIKFQTPFVPSSLVEGVEVIGQYPNQGEQMTVAEVGYIKEFSSASPMNPIGTHVPKNLFFPVKRDYVRITSREPSINVEKGELRCTNSSQTTSDKIYFVFPPDVYTSATPYSFTDGDKFETTDYAFLKVDYNSFQTHSHETKIGNFKDTSVHGTFYSTSHSDYYYSPNTSRSDPASTVKSGKIVAYKRLDNLGEGTQVGGSSICEFGNLETSTVFWNTKPSNQAMGVVKLDANKDDSASFPITTATGGAISPGFFESGLSNQSNTFSISKTGGTSPSAYHNVVDIVNVVTEQNDDRYGDAADRHDMVFTGTNYVFSASERATLETTGQVTLTLSVAGGDCYVSLHQFKLTDTHYGLTNIEKVGSGSQLTKRDLRRRWTTLFINNQTNTGDNGADYAMMPVPYRNMSQVLSVYLESEVNGEILAPRVYPIDNGLQTETENEYNLRTPFTYIYNNNYSRASDQKAFIPFDEDERVTTKFKSRVIFSDQKIYNTDNQGFDIFRALSTGDLEETYGGITKLVLTGHELYALQERAIALLPIDVQMTETADGSTIALRSSVVVDTPRYLSRQYGCSHLKGVCQIDNAVFFPDTFNKVVIKMENNQLDLISENGMITTFKDLQSSTFVTSLFDNKRRQYWLGVDGDTWIWDDRLKVWVSNYEFPDLRGGVFTKDEVYLLGMVTSDLLVTEDLRVFKMYSGTYNSLMGTTVTPRVTMIVNPEYEFGKVFDNLVVYSSSALADADMITESDSGLNQTVSAMSLAQTREGNYRIATLRDSSNGRLRGQRATLTLNWPTSDTKISVNQVVTHYRYSERKI